MFNAGRAFRVVASWFGWYRWIEVVEPGWKIGVLDLIAEPGWNGTEHWPRVWVRRKPLMGMTYDPATGRATPFPYRVR